jgi:ABC-2 type transport system ATP-binding protein
MDEPTNGLDIPSKSEFRKLMAKTMNDEKIYIISTHQVRDLDHILDHIIIVNSGQIVLDASVFEISNKIAFS